VIVGVVIVAGSGLLGATLLSDEDTVSVWATRDALAAGEPVRGDALARREVRFADQDDADRYVSAARPVPPGATAARDVGAGELLPRAAIATEAEPPVAEVPLRVAAEAVPLSVRPGSVVDVWVTPLPDRAAVGDAGPADLVMSGVRVLAVSHGGGAFGAATERQVVVGLDQSQESDLDEALAAIAGGDVVLVRTP